MENSGAGNIRFTVYKIHWGEPTLLSESPPE